MKPSLTSRLALSAALSIGAFQGCTVLAPVPAALPSAQASLPSAEPTPTLAPTPEPTATLTPSVVGNASKAVTSVQITPSTNLSLKVGETLQLDAVVLYSDGTFSKSVEWHSNNLSVATVDPKTGLVTGVGEGAVQISAIAGRLGQIIEASVTPLIRNVQPTTPNLRVTNSLRIPLPPDTRSHDKAPVAWSKDEASLIVPVIDDTNHSLIEVMLPHVSPNPVTRQVSSGNVNYPSMLNGGQLLSLKTFSSKIQPVRTSLTGNDEHVFPLAFDKNSENIWDLRWNSTRDRVLFVMETVMEINPLSSPKVLSGPDIFEASIYNNERKQLTQDGTSRYADWSPSDGKIVFTKEVGPGYALFFMDSDGRNQTRVSPNIAPYHYVSAAWSPNGLYLAVSSFDSITSRLSVLDRNGVTLLEVNEEYGSPSVPSWSPSGSKLAIHDHRGLLVFEISPQ